MSMLYRCGKCRRFFWITLVSHANCECCNFTACRCKDCGGDAGAARSLASHRAWYRGIGVKRYKHVDFHNPEFRVKRPVTPRASSPRGLAGKLRLAS